MVSFTSGNTLVGQVAADSDAQLAGDILVRLQAEAFVSLQFVNEQRNVHGYPRWSQASRAAKAAPTRAPIQRMARNPPRISLMSAWLPWMRPLCSRKAASCNSRHWVSLANSVVCTPSLSLISSRSSWRDSRICFSSERTSSMIDGSGDIVLYAHTGGNMRYLFIVA